MRRLATGLELFIQLVIGLRMLRLVRTLRILRLFKLFRYNEALKSFSASCAKVKRELYVLGIAVVFLVFFSGALVYESERAAQPQVFGRFSDGIWWSVVTLTTVGYGDKFPVTFAGRVTACGTLFLGLGLFGSFVSLIGGAFAATLNEDRRQEQGFRLSVETSRRLARWLEASHRPATEQNVDHWIQRALDGSEESPGGVPHDNAPHSGRGAT